MGQAIPVLQVLGYWGNLGKPGLNAPNHVQGHMESNTKSLTPCLTPHQMRLYSSVRALCGLSYICFSATQVLGQFGETGLEYPKSHAGTYEK